MLQDTLIAGNHAHFLVDAKRMLSHHAKTLLVSPHGGSPYTVALPVHCPATEVDAPLAYGCEGYLAVLQAQFACLDLDGFDDSWRILLVAEDNHVIHVPCQAWLLQLSQDKPVHIGKVEVAVVLAGHGSDGYAHLRIGLIGIYASLHQLDGSLSLVLMPDFLLQPSLDDARIEMMKIGLDEVIVLRMAIKVTPHLLVCPQRATPLDGSKGAVYKKPLDTKSRYEGLIDDAGLHVNDVYFPPLSFGE